MPVLFKDLEHSYELLLDSMVVKDSWKNAINSRAIKLYANRARYERAASKIGIPWETVAVIHNLEGSADFSTHLHNGDPLSARTYHEPPGRPLVGTPPFTWEESAIDAMKMKSWEKIKDWSDARLCFELERYNGFGYHYRNRTSPYLWSGTNHYTIGKFTSDGHYDASAVSRQIGAIPLLFAIREISKRSESTSDLKSVSTKVTFIRRAITTIKAAFTAVAGVVTLDTMDIAKGFIDRLNSIPFKWIGILILLLVGYLSFRYLEKKINQDAVEGRYTPSGEMNHDIDFNEPVVRAPSDDDHADHSQESGSQDERVGVESGSGEATSPDTNPTPTGDDKGNPG